MIPFARAWTHLRFAAELWRDRPDLTWVPAHTLPALFPGRAAVTIHDLGYKLFPQAHPPMQRLYLDLTTRYSAARAAVVLADSQATADDLTRFYGTPASKIRVVYPGVDAPPVGDVAAVRAKYGLPERYFLFLGTLQPRKNIRADRGGVSSMAGGASRRPGGAGAGGRAGLALRSGVDGGRRRRYPSPATSTLRTKARSMPERWRWSFRRCTRASAFRCWRRCFAARR